VNDGYRSLLWYLLLGTRGGPNRIRILERLETRPHNAHQLAEGLGMDYRTARHHLRILEKNGLVRRPVGDTYASPYELGPNLAAEFGIIAELRATRPRDRGRIRSRLDAGAGSLPG
jgi:DNA-binding transcriptional ArsR family regulator